MRTIQESDLARVNKIAAGCFQEEVLLEAERISIQTTLIENRLFLGYIGAFFDQIRQMNFELYALLYKLAYISLSRKNIQPYVRFLEQLKHEEYLMDNVQIEVSRGILSTPGLKLWD